MLNGGQQSVASDRIKPTSDAFYTARPTYINLLLLLEDLVRRSKRSLEQVYVLKPNAPPPSLELLAQMQGQDIAVVLEMNKQRPWLKKQHMGAALGLPLKSAQYRNIITSLSELSRYSPLVEQHLASSSKSAHADLAAQIAEITEEYKRPTNASDLVGLRMRSKTGVDSAGRIWANGKRKESSAMVYIAPVVQSEGQKETLGEVLVNGSSISTYFTRTTHREAVLHPLRLANLLGQFNIFALASGGGHSGQAGAVAHGLAKALVRFFEEKELAARTASSQSGGSQGAAGVNLSEWTRLKNSVKELLVKDGVLLRDPRMVERKKTGLAKARKAYTWVKR